MQIGKSFENNQNFKGSLDEFAIFERGLNFSEVNSTFYNGSCHFGC